jgi:hypothetical protein
MGWEGRPRDWWTRSSPDIGGGTRNMAFSGFGVVRVSCRCIGRRRSLAYSRAGLTQKQFILFRGWKVGRLSTSPDAKRVIHRAQGTFTGVGATLELPAFTGAGRRSRRPKVSFDHQLNPDAPPPSARQSFSPRRIDSKPISARLWTERIQTCCLRERWRASRHGSTAAEVPKTTTSTRRRRIFPRHSDCRR